MQFNEASLNSLPGAADRSRGTDGRRAARGLGGVGRDDGGEREGDPASTTIRKSSLGYAAMRAEGKREALSLAGAFAPLRLNTPAKELLTKTLIEKEREKRIQEWIMIRKISCLAYCRLNRPSHICSYIKLKGIESTLLKCGNSDDFR